MPLPHAPHHNEERWSLRARAIGAPLTTLALTIVACSTWSRDPQGLAAIPAGAPTESTVVRLVRQDQTRVTMYAPRFVGDSVVGTWRDLLGERRVAVAARDVQSVEVRRFSANRTAFLIAGIGVTVIVVAGAADGWGQPAPPPPPPSSDGAMCCPVVYSWTGREWQMDAGTFAAAVARGFQRTDVDNLELAVPSGDVLRLRLANIEPESDHVDALAVLAVDHDPGVVVAPDAFGRLHATAQVQPPVSALDDRGRDVRSRVLAADDHAWESAVMPRDTGVAADVRDGIVVAFVRPADAQRAHLVVHARHTPWAAHLVRAFVRLHGRETAAWADSLVASPAFAMASGMPIVREGFLAVSVSTPAGWRRVGSLSSSGPEVLKRQIVELDLRAVVGDTVSVRLESAPSLWLIDAVAVGWGADRPIVTRTLPLTSARGTDGTDALPLLTSMDGQHLVLRDSALVDLEAVVPALPGGTARSFLVQVTGWYDVRGGPEEPDRATLALLARDTLGVSKAATDRLNRAVAALSRR